MNSEQIQGQIRLWLVGLAGLIGGWFASKGWLTEGMVSAILNSPVFIAVVTMIGGAVWSWLNKTDHALVASVDALAKKPDSPVKGVITAPTVAGAALAYSLPGKTTVPAGTSDAQSMAKS